MLAVMRYMAIFIIGFLGSCGVYLLSSGLLYLIFWKNKRSEKMRLPIEYKKLANPKSEFWLSIGALLIFSLNMPLLEFVRISTGYTRGYGEISKYGWPYFFASIFIMAFLTDTYFYWTHRLFHLNRFYQLLHARHHQFENPTPFGGFASGALEVSLFTFSLFLITLFVPWHPLALYIYSAYAIGWITFIHLGYNPLRARVFDKTLYLPSHHGVHHDEYRHNYGLYFMFWDKLCGTYKKIPTRESRSP